MKQAYRVELVEVENVNGDFKSELPEIIKAPIEDVEGTDWRTAKKQLRQWYLDKAAALRKVSEKSYFEVE